MARFGSFGEKYKPVINICYQCNHVAEAKMYQDQCANCSAVGVLFFETAEKFSKFCQLYKPTYLKTTEEHLQYIIDEALGLV